MEFQIRPLENADLGEVVAAWNECLVYDRVTEPRFAEVILGDPNYEPNGTLVARDQGHLTGFISVVTREGIEGKDGKGRPEEAHLGYLKGFFVRPEYEATPAGERLLEAAIQWLRTKRKEVLRVGLYTGRYFFPGIDVRYEALARFFERHGFERLQLINDLSVRLADFEPSAYQEEARQRAAAAGVTVTSYRPEMLEAMREFVRRVDIHHWFPAGWEEGFGRGDCTLVARRGEEIVGWAEYWPHPHQGGFGPIAVLPEERHQGIGTGLLLESMLRMKAQGVPEAVAGWAATEFYQRSGWEVCRQYEAWQKRIL